MKRLFAFALSVALLAAPVAAAAYCVTQTVIGPGGRVVICTTCCYGNNCTTTCV